MNGKGKRYCSGLRKSILTGLLALGCFLNAFAEPESIINKLLNAKKIDEAFKYEFREYVKRNRKFFGVPGNAVVIVKNGEIVFAEGFGVRELGKNAKVTPRTLFNIGSMGKSMTAMMAGSLIDEGYYNWNTPVIEMMPAFTLSDPDAAQKMTLVELFSHTSGLSPVDPALLLSGLAPQDFVNFIREVPLLNPPGQHYMYNNTMYAIGAYAAVLGGGAQYESDLLEAFRQQIQKRVFEPIDMSRTGVSVSFLKGSSNRASPHLNNLNGDIAANGFTTFPTAYWDITAMAPSGSVYSNALDLGKYLITVLNGGVSPAGRRIISRVNLDKLLTPQIKVGNGAYGLGWFIGDYQGIPVKQHNGGLGGFGSTMAIIPEANIGIAVLSNSNLTGQIFNDSVQYRLLEMLFDLPPFIEQQTQTTLVTAANNLSQFYSTLQPADAEALRPYLVKYSIPGKYSQLGGDPIGLELRDGRLWLRVGETYVSEYLQGADGEYYAITGDAAVNQEKLALATTDSGTRLLTISDSTGANVILRQIEGDQSETDCGSNHRDENTNDHADNLDCSRHHDHRNREKT